MRKKKNKQEQISCTHITLTEKVVNNFTLCGRKSTGKSIWNWSSYMWIRYINILKNRLYRDCSQAWHSLEWAIFILMQHEQFQSNENRRAFPRPHSRSEAFVRNAVAFSHILFDFLFISNVLLYYQFLSLFLAVTVTAAVAVAILLILHWLRCICLTLWAHWAN